MEIILVIALTIWSGCLTYYLIQTRDKVGEMDQRRFVKELFQPDAPLDAEIVSFKKHTIADRKKEKKLQIDKELEDFNFQHLSHGKTQGDS